MYNIVIQNISTIMSENKKSFDTIIMQNKYIQIYFYFVQLCVNVTVRMEELILDLVDVPASKDGLETVWYW